MKINEHAHQAKILRLYSYPDIPQHQKLREKYIKHMKEQHGIVL